MEKSNNDTTLIEELENTLTRLALISDSGKLQQVLTKLLPSLLVKLGEHQHDGGGEVRNTIIKVLNHILKWVKPETTVQLPIDSISEFIYPKNGLVSSFAIVFMEIAIERSSDLKEHAVKLFPVVLQCCCGENKTHYLNEEPILIKLLCIGLFHDASLIYNNAASKEENDYLQALAVQVSLKSLLSKPNRLEKMFSYFYSIQVDICKHVIEACRANLLHWSKIIVLISGATCLSTDQELALRCEDDFKFILNSPENNKHLLLLLEPQERTAFVNMLLSLILLYDNGVVKLENEMPLKAKVLAFEFLLGRTDSLMREVSYQSLMKLVMKYLINNEESIQLRLLCVRLISQMFLLQSDLPLLNLTNSFLFASLRRRFSILLANNGSSSNDGELNAICWAFTCWGKFHGRLGVKNNHVDLPLLDALLSLLLIPGRSASAHECLNNIVPLYGGDASLLLGFLIAKFQPSLRAKEAVEAIRAVRFFVLEALENVFLKPRVLLNDCRIPFVLAISLRSQHKVARELASKLVVESRLKNNVSFFAFIQHCAPHLAADSDHDTIISLLTFAFEELYDDANPAALEMLLPHALRWLSFADEDHSLCLLDASGGFFILCAKILVEAAKVGAFAERHAGVSQWLQRNVFARFPSNLPVLLAGAELNARVVEEENFLPPPTPPPHWVILTACFLLRTCAEPMRIKLNALLAQTCAAFLNKLKPADGEASVGERVCIFAMSHISAQSDDRALVEASLQCVRKHHREALTEACIGLVSKLNDPDQIRGEVLPVLLEVAADKTYGLGVQLCSGAALARVLSKLGDHAVLERVVGMVNNNSTPHECLTVSIWLYEIAKQTKEPVPAPLCEELIAAVCSLLGEETQLTRHYAARALGAMFSPGCALLPQSGLSAFVTLVARHVSVGSEARVEKRMRRGSENRIRPYKDLISMASSCGKVSLFFVFLNFLFESGENKVKKILHDTNDPSVLARLFRKTYLARFDGGYKSEDADVDAHLLSSACGAVQGELKGRFDVREHKAAILEEAIAGLTQSRVARERHTCLLGLAKLLSEVELDATDLAAVWVCCFHALDDMDGLVNQNTALSKAVRRSTVASFKRGGNAEEEASVLDVLVKRGLSSSVVAVRKVSLWKTRGSGDVNVKKLSTATLVELVSLRSLPKTKLSDVVGSLVRLISESESAVLGYAQFHATGAENSTGEINIEYSKLEELRVQGALASGEFQAARLCVSRLGEEAEGIGEFVKAILLELVAIVARGVGLPSISCAVQLIAFVFSSEMSSAHAPGLETAPVALSALLLKLQTDPSAELKKRCGGCAALVVCALARAGVKEPVRRFLCGVQDLNHATVDDGAVPARLAVAYACGELLTKVAEETGANEEVREVVVSKAMLVAWLGRNEDNETVAKAFNRVYLLHKHLLQRHARAFEWEVLETAKVCISASSYRRKQLIAVALGKETDLSFLALDATGSFFSLLLDAALNGTVEYKGKEDVFKCVGVLYVACYSKREDLFPFSPLVDSLLKELSLLVERGKSVFLLESVALCLDEVLRCRGEGGKKRAVAEFVVANFFGSLRVQEEAVANALTIASLLRVLTSCFAYLVSGEDKSQVGTLFEGLVNLATSLLLTSGAPWNVRMNVFYLIQQLLKFNANDDRLVMLVKKELVESKKALVLLSVLSCCEGERAFLEEVKTFAHSYNGDNQQVRAKVAKILHTFGM